MSPTNKVIDKKIINLSQHDFLTNKDDDTATTIAKSILKSLKDYYYVVNGDNNVNLEEKQKKLNNKDNNESVKVENNNDKTNYIINKITERMVSSSFTQHFITTKNDCCINKKFIGISELSVTNLLYGFIDKNNKTTKKNDIKNNSGQKNENKPNKKRNYIPQWYLDSYITKLKEEKESFIVEFKFGESVNGSIIDIIRSISLMDKMKVDKTFIVYLKRPSINELVITSAKESGLTLNNEKDINNYLVSKYCFIHSFFDSTKIEKKETPNEKTTSGGKNLEDKNILEIVSDIIRWKESSFENVVDNLINFLNNDGNDSNINDATKQNNLTDSNTSQILSNKNEINIFELDGKKIGINYESSNEQDESKDDIDENFEEINNMFLVSLQNILNTIENIYEDKNYNNFELDKIYKKYIDNKKHKLFCMFSFDNIKSPNKTKTIKWKSLFTNNVMEYMFTMIDDSNIINEKLILSIIDFVSSEEFKKFFNIDKKNEQENLIIGDLDNLGQIELVKYDDSNDNMEKLYETISEKIFTYQREIYKVIKNHANKNIEAEMKHKKTKKKLKDNTVATSSDNTTIFRANSKVKNVLLAMLKKLFDESKYSKNKNCPKGIFESQIEKISLNNFKYEYSNESNNSKNKNNETNDTISFTTNEFLFKVIYVLYFYAKINSINIDLFSTLNNDNKRFWKEIMCKSSYLNDSAFSENVSIDFYSIFKNDNNNALNYLHNLDRIFNLKYSDSETIAGKFSTIFNILILLMQPIKYN